MLVRSSATLSQLTQSQSFAFAQKVDSLAAAVFDEEVSLFVVWFSDGAGCANAVTRYRLKKIAG